jgi:hypothetical protein
MKQIILTISLVLLTSIGYSQDRIITTLGDTIECNIIGLSESINNNINIQLTDGEVKKSGSQIIKTLNVNNISECIWDGKILSTHQLNTMALNIKFNKLIKLSKVNLNLPKVGFQRMKWGGAFVLIGGAAMATGMILSMSPNDPKLISALMIGGSVNITLGGGLLLSGGYKNSRLR